ncbi:MAG: hypothetical protein ACJA2C_002798, partial [Marinoscillum sp.]
MLGIVIFWIGCTIASGVIGGNRQMGSTSGFLWGLFLG